MLQTNQIKHGFFNKCPTKTQGLPFKHGSFNLTQLRAEFDSLYLIFLSNKVQLTQQSEIILYLRYLCDLLIEYYHRDYVKKDLDEFLLKCQKLNNFIHPDGSQQKADIDLNFVSFISMQFKNKALDYGAAFTSSAKLREHISTLNSTRSQWNYSLTLASHSIICLQNYGIPAVFRNITEFLGTRYNPDEVINLLNKSRNSLRVLSVGLFAFRFLINLTMMTKHCLQAATNQELSFAKIVRQEFEKRGFTMASDLVWGIVNMLTNYNEVFHLSPSVTSPVVSTFLIFDILVFIGQWSVEANKYHTAIKELLIQKSEPHSDLELTVINRQLDVLNDTWKAASAYYQFNSAGAILLVISFVSTLLCSGPFSLAMLAGFSMSGNAIYNSANEFRQYIAATVAIKREAANGLILADKHHHNLFSQLSVESNAASNTFYSTLCLNAGATAFIIVAAAISWPVALGLALSYMAYMTHHAFERQERQDAQKHEHPHNIYRLFTPASQENSDPKLLQPQM